VSALVIAIVLALAAPAVASADPFRDLDLVRPGQRKPAPDFSVAGLGGGRLALRAFRGTVVFLNFWATWCPPCKTEMPSMERLHRRYRERGLTMLAISIDSAGDARAVADFVKAHGLTFLIGLDPNLEVADPYGVRVLPSTLLIDRAGNTVAIALGPRAWDAPAAHAVIESLLK
jgi:peroxiredoxin